MQQPEWRPQGGCSLRGEGSSASRHWFPPQQHGHGYGDAQKGRCTRPAVRSPNEVGVLVGGVLQQLEGFDTGSDAEGRVGGAGRGCEWLG